MPSQRYLPVMEDGKTQVLGLVDLGADAVFSGNETTITLTGMPPGANTSQRVEKFIPPPSTHRKQSAWYMVARFTHQEVLDKAYTGIKFVNPKGVDSSNTWSSGSGYPNVLRQYVGLMEKGQTRTQGFIPGPPPAPLPEGFVLEDAGRFIAGTGRVGYPIYFTESKYVGINPEDGYVGYMVLRDAEALPALGSDGSTHESVYVPNFVPEIADLGVEIRIVEVIFNETYDAIIYVGTANGPVGPLTAEDPSQPPQPVHPDPFPLIADAGVWQVNAFDTSFLARGTGKAMSYEWFVNEVSQGPASPWDSYNINVANLGVEGVVPGDVLRVEYTCTDSQGANTISSLPLTATVENLA